MTGPLARKVALVTGAGQGAGLGVAEALADDGATVAVVGRTRSKLETVVEGIESRRREGGRRPLRRRIGRRDRRHRRSRSSPSSARSTSS